jgi:hypothetical protein
MIDNFMQKAPPATDRYLGIDASHALRIVIAGYGASQC